MNIDITIFSYETIGIWIIAFLIMEFPMRYIYLKSSKPSSFLQRWYSFDEFSPYTVIIGDLFYMLVGLIIAYRIHAYFCKNIKGFANRFISLFLIFWAIQMVGDLLFYQVITRIPNASENNWLKFFIDYGGSAKLNAVFGDSLYIFVWALTVCCVQYIPKDLLLCLFFFYIFVISIMASKKKLN